MGGSSACSSSSAALPDDFDDGESLADSSSGDASSCDEDAGFLSERAMAAQRRRAKALKHAAARGKTVKCKAATSRTSVPPTAPGLKGGGGRRAAAAPASSSATTFSGAAASGKGAALSASHVPGTTDMQLVELRELAARRVPPGGLYAAADKAARYRRQPAITLEAGGHPLGRLLVERLGFRFAPVTSGDGNSVHSCLARLKHGDASRWRKVRDAIRDDLRRQRSEVEETLKAETCHKTWKSALASTGERENPLTATEWRVVQQLFDVTPRHVWITSAGEVRSSLTSGFATFSLCGQLLDADAVALFQRRELVMLRSPGGSGHYDILVQPQAEGREFECGCANCDGPMPWPPATEGAVGGHPCGATRLAAVGLRVAKMPFDTLSAWGSLARVLPEVPSITSLRDMVEDAKGPHRDTGFCVETGFPYDRDWHCCQNDPWAAPDKRRRPMTSFEWARVHDLYPRLLVVGVTPGGLDGMWAGSHDFISPLTASDIAALVAEQVPMVLRTAAPASWSVERSYCHFDALIPHDLARGSAQAEPASNPSASSAVGSVATSGVPGPLV